MNCWVIITVLLFANCNESLITGKEQKPGKVENLTDRNEQPGEEIQSMSDFEPVPLDRLIGISDVIAFGNITGMNDTAFNFSMVEKVAGNPVSSTIEVKQYHPNRFEGGKRLIPYETNQSFLLFLKIDPRKPSGNSYVILGAAGEGEMPVLNNYVYFVRRNVEILPLQQYDLYGTKQNIQRYDLKKFIEAVSGYSKCFKWQTSQPQQVCDQANLKKYSNTSEMQNYLVQLSKPYIKN